MSVPIKNVKRPRGDTKDFVLVLSKNGTVYPLTGCSAKLSVNSKKNPTTNDYLFQSVATVDVPNGTLTFPFSAGDVDHIGEYYYDVEIIDGLGKISTILKGKWTYEQDITKD